MRVLLLFFHSNFEQSRINRALQYQAMQANVTLRDMYEIYPTGEINIQTEQQLLTAHDVVVFQHPLYWYSCPPLMKQWIDQVLTLNWAYGPQGTALQGKYWVQAFSHGGGLETYSRDARNHFSLAEFLRPFEQTAYLCKMRYLRPFMTELVAVGDEAYLNNHAESYRAWLDGMALGNLPDEVNTYFAPLVDYKKVDY